MKTTKLLSILLCALCAQAQNTLLLTGPATITGPTLTLTVSITGSAALGLNAIGGAVGWNIQISQGISPGNQKIWGVNAPILSVTGLNVTCEGVPPVVNSLVTFTSNQTGVVHKDDLTLSKCTSLGNSPLGGFVDGVVATITIAAPVIVAPATSQMYFLENTGAIVFDATACPSPVAPSTAIFGCTDDVYINGGAYPSASYIVKAAAK